MSTPAGTPERNVDTVRSGRAKGPAKQSTRRGFAGLIALFVILLGCVAASTQWATPKGSWAPKLGLDLRGGRQIVLEPTLTGGKKVTSGEINEAVNIIRNRIDATGTAEAEVTTLGANDIVISIPGNPSQEILDSLARSAQLNFRAVISQATGTPVATSPYQLPQIISNNAKSSTSSKATTTPSTKATAQASAPAGQSSAKASSASSTSSKDILPAAFATDAPLDGSDTAWGAQKVSAAWVNAGTARADSTYNDLLNMYGCTPAYQAISASIPNNQPNVLCSSDGQAKYLVGPVEVKGSDLSDASAGPESNSQGNQTGGTAVNLTLNGAGKTAFANVTKRLAKLSPPRNEFAITVDGQSISAPAVSEPLTTGQAQITGGFTESSGKLLANSLKYGSLPLSFHELTSNQISPQLGSDQLSKGLIAGGIGFLLVIAYSLFQYRALGMLTIASLAVSASLTYLAVTLLGTLTDFRLSMAGVTGLIVSIGITADSFIVYFERVRDEVRAGRPLRAAVETGWTRAKRTIIISDAVNFLAAAVLYLLSESTVKAFAFTLGLTTLIDVAVVMLFTHPAFTRLARTAFFGGGHPASGLDPQRLGARVATYAGRGRLTIADRRRAGEEDSI